MGFFDNIFGGGTRDEKSIQADINRVYRENDGQYSEEAAPFIAERELVRSGASGGSALSQGLGSFGRAVSSIPGRHCARCKDGGISAGVFSGRDKQAENLARKGFSQADIEDYFARTDATIARNKAQQNFMRNDQIG
jgi:hypothetical protein